MLCTLEPNLELYTCSEFKKRQKALEKAKEKAEKEVGS
jgi:hypothetical protein